MREAWWDGGRHEGKKRDRVLRREEGWERGN